MGAPSAPGLSDYLAGEADEFSIRSGRPRRKIFFSSPAGRSVFKSGGITCKQPAEEPAGTNGFPCFEWIIVDAPPVLPVSDASVLAGMCDGVIFCAPCGEAAFDLAQTACLEFRENHLLVRC